MLLLSVVCLNLVSLYLNLFGCEFGVLFEVRWFGWCYAIIVLLFLLCFFRSLFCVSYYLLCFW